MLNILCATLLPIFIHSTCKRVYSIREENSVNPDQMTSSVAVDLDLQCFQKKKKERKEMKEKKNK